MQTLLAVFGAIAVVASGVKVIIGFFSPYKKIKERVDKHDGLLANDNKRIKQSEDAIKVLMQSLIAHIDNGISGNSPDELKKAKESLSSYLIHR